MKALSIGSLIEYIYASPARREAILVGAINPSLYLLDRYGLTYRLATSALTSRITDNFDAALATLIGKTARNEKHEQRMANTRESIPLAKTMIEKLLLKDANYLKLGTVDNAIELEGLSIRINPQSISIQQNSNGERTVGIVKLCCSKGFDLEEERGLDFAALLHWFAETRLKPIGKSDPAQCIVVDVFRGTSASAPKNFKLRRKRISAACREIVDRWDRLADRLNDTSPTSTKKAA